MFTGVTLSLLNGFFVTVKLFILTLLFAFPVGLIICFGERSKHNIIRYPSQWLVWAIRGTPLMLQLLIIYYGPGIFFDNPLWDSGASGRFMAALIAFVLNYACYFAEIYRGGIQSISSGQREAGEVLGMTRWEIFYHVILLQVIKRILAPISNEVIALVKDTSLVRVIAVYEIIWEGQAYIKRAGIIWPLFYTGLFYLTFSGLMTILFRYFEKKLDYFH